MGGEGMDPSSGPTWRPRGVLVAHLIEHRKGVNRLAISRGGAFFVSASNDETVKVWYFEVGASDFRLLCEVAMKSIP